MEETTMKKFGPVKAEEELLGAVVNYCEKTFPLEKSAPVGDEGECGMKLLSKMRSFLRGTQKGQARLMGEQYVERIVPYAMSETPIGEIGLQDETALAFARYLAGPDALAKPNANNNGRPVVKLYEHQEKSFKILTSNDPAVRKQHLVVCSGTGSGKTESFLIPLIDVIVKERKEKGTEYKPGVRALILYPMNALVNDQLRRLKAIISEIDDEALRPTFGRYTGELKRESELDTNDESIDELNIGADGAKKILKTIQDGLNCGDVLDRATLKLKGLDERISQQYQTRKQWADAPADILVTNYAMLERLLLRPDARGLFSTEQDGVSTWRFIALDEAHSYTGSQGTEIAWLIRRLLGRLRVPNKVRFLATSATLRSRREGESDEQLAAWIAEHFAARIFPAKASDFHIEPGRPYCPDEMLGEQGGGYLGRIFCPVEEGGPVLLDEKGIALFDRTAELLMKDKILGESIGNFKSLVEVDALPDTYKATEIDHIIRLLKFDLSKVDGAFDGWDLDTCEFPAVKVTNGMRSAVKWLMEQINVPGFWYRYLSDPLTKRKDIAEKILEQWKDANANEWSGAAFSAFYRAIGDMVDSSTPYCEDDSLVSELFKRVQAFEVTPTEKIKQVLVAFRAKCKEDKAEIKSEEAELVAEWSKKCGVAATAGDGLEKFLFKILGGRNDIAKAVETLSRKMISVDGLCNEMAVPQEELFALLQLAMMAKKPGMRSPVLDVRYHQMIRGAFDVGVYFGDGSIPSVNFYRSDENACGDNRPLFSLGVCRDCGQLFLIGYTANSDFSVPQVLVRNKSASFNEFHVFAWYQGRADHADLLNNEQSKQDEGKEICYVNLNDGLVVDKTGYDALSEGDRAGYVQMYWHRRATSRSFVQVCPNCGKFGSSIGSPEYGIITPYVASDIQFKTEVLEEFVKGAVPDVDPAVSHRPGKGRKVLTFADSRARAAEMPAKFDENYNRKFFDDRIHEIVKEKPEVSHEIQEVIKRVAILKAVPGGDELISPDELRLMSSAEIWNLDNLARALLVELRKNRLEDMLSVTQLDSTRRGTPLELEAAAKYRIIHALHDSSRTGLLRGERVTVESQHIREKAKDYFNNNLTMAGWAAGQRETFIEGMEPLLQNLFALIFARTWMTVGQSGLDMVWQTTGGFSKCLCMNEPPPRPNGASSPDFELITVGKYKKTCKKFCSDKLNMELSDELCIAVLQTFFGFLIEPQQVGVDQNTGVFINDALLVPICLLGNGGVPQDGLTSYKALSIRFLIKDLVVKFWKEPTQGFKYTDAERIRVEEHTAQLSSRQGRLYQQGFSDGRINILSCSTTFEMGIDKF